MHIPVQQTIVEDKLMAFHSRLISGQTEWVLSIIGAIEPANQQEVKELYHSFPNPPACCTVDFSQALTEVKTALEILRLLSRYIPSIQIIGCSSPWIALLRSEAGSSVERIRFL
jgi:hypothetical protein